MVIYKTSWVELSILMGKMPNEEKSMQLEVFFERQKYHHSTISGMHILGQSNWLCCRITLCLLHKTENLHYSKCFYDVMLRKTKDSEVISDLEHLNLLKIVAFEERWSYLSCRSTLLFSATISMRIPSKFRCSTSVRYQVNRSHLIYLCLARFRRKNAILKKSGCDFQ